MKLFTRILAFGAVAMSMTCGLFSDTYPTKPIRMLVGFAPGGGTDVVARIIGQKMGEYLGVSVVVENHPGGTGTIAADLVAKARPDGYTILMGHVNSNAIAPNLFKKMAYDAIKDFQPVVYVGYVPNILVVNLTVPVKNVAELITYSKANPDKVTYASSGIGSTQHLAGEMFKLLTGTTLVHVPYKGSGQAIIDLLAGTVSVNFDTMPPVLPHIQAGKLKALAISTPKRISQLPDVPTFEEVGIKGFDVTNWYGVFAPAKTPKEIVDKLNAVINKVMESPDVKAKLEAVGTQLGGGTPEEFASFLRTELIKYQKLIKDAKVTIE